MDYSILERSDDGPDTTTRLRHMPRKLARVGVHVIEEYRAGDLVRVYVDGMTDPRTFVRAVRDRRTGRLVLALAFKAPS